MFGNELHRGDGLRTVSRTAERDEVTVPGYDVIRSCGDRTVGELVVVGIGRDDFKAKSRTHMPDVSAGLFEEFDEADQLPSRSNIDFPRGDLLVLQENLSGDRPDQPALQKCLPDG